MGCPERCPTAMGPPPMPPHLFAPGDHVWRDGSYGAVFHVSSRDAFGFLVWPGKTPPGAVAP